MDVEEVRASGAFSFGLAAELSWVGRTAEHGSPTS
jgi:hypothetical protein